MHTQARGVGVGKKVNLIIIFFILFNVFLLLLCRMLSGKRREEKKRNKCVPDWFFNYHLKTVRIQLIILKCNFECEIAFYNNFGWMLPSSPSSILFNAEMMMRMHLRWKWRLNLLFKMKNSNNKQTNMTKGKREAKERLVAYTRCALDVPCTRYKSKHDERLNRNKLPSPPTTNTTTICHYYYHYHHHHTSHHHHQHRRRLRRYFAVKKVFRTNINNQTTCNACRENERSFVACLLIYTSRCHLICLFITFLVFYSIYLFIFALDKDGWWWFSLQSYRHRR